MVGGKQTLFDSLNTYFIHVIFKSCNILVHVILNWLKVWITKTTYRRLCIL